MEHDLEFGFKRVEESASNLAAIIDACLVTGRMSDMIERFVKTLAFRRYSKAVSVYETEVVEGAVTKFLLTGSEYFVSEHVEESLDKVEELEDLVNDVRTSDFFDALVKATAATVREGFPAATSEQVEVISSDRVLERAVQVAHDLDPSTPLDAVKGTSLVFCYVPGLDAASTLEETMTSYWSDESSSLTIRPDMVFARFLKLAGVSKEQWLTTVEEVCGVDLREDPPQGSAAWMWERAEAWRRFNPPDEAGRKPITRISDIVEAVDNVPGGFTPSIAFMADAHAIVTRDWNKPLSVKGGVIGLSDLINGSGDPIRFEGTAILSGEREDFVLSANMPNPLEKAYGLHPSAFSSQILDLHRSRKAGEEARWNVFSERSVA